MKLAESVYWEKRNGKMAEVKSKRAILFIQEPNYGSEILNMPELEEHFKLLYHILTTKEDFLAYLETVKDENIVAIYGGYPAFVPIGGLTRELVMNPLFPRKTLKCIALCARGYNGIDLDVLRENNIQLFNYQDAVDEYDLTGFKVDLVGNDVADCVLWHVLEGFRKFSYQQSVARRCGNTVLARGLIAGHSEAEIAEKHQYVFGHELRRNNGYSLSPRGKKCLILGLGNIGKQIGLKLQNGLGLEIHFSKKSADPNVEKRYGWTFHPFNSEQLKECLHQFSVIVVALPGNKDTYHLIDSEFLSYCNGPELILVNIGRGDILDMPAIEDALKNNRLRHLGVDVFHNEPLIEELLKKDDFFTSITPHLGSVTKEGFEQSCDLALVNIMRSVEDGEYCSSLSRVV